MLRQTSMYLGKGIIIGAINRLQLNKWGADWLIQGRVWQLIAIFDKEQRYGLGLAQTLKKERTLPKTRL